MNYEVLLESVKEVSKESLKKIVFELDQQNYNRLKEMDIDDELKKKTIIHVQRSVVL